MPWENFNTDWLIKPIQLFIYLGLLLFKFYAHKHSSRALNNLSNIIVQTKLILFDL